MNNHFIRIVILAVAMLFTAIAQADILQDDFGSLPDGTTVQRWTLTSSGGASVAIISYGATIVSLKVPDQDRKLADVVLGFDQLKSYVTSSPYFGATIGRYANRIGGARFTLNGQEFHLAPNDGHNTLHGGRRGFDKVLWTGARTDPQTVEFTYLSKDGEEGFPGNLTVHVRYSLSDSNALRIDYSATTDKDTVLNLTNHSYFNLAGQGNGTVLKQELTIDADQITPTDSRLIPTGQLAPVENTPFDFRQSHPIGQRITADNDQLRGAHGYDMNFVLTQRDGLRHAATVFDPASGRTMEVWTTEPAVQLYSGSGLDASLIGKAGKRYSKNGAFCLETQHFPDSPNHPNFPSTVLKPGDTYRTTTEYRFTAKPSSPAGAAPDAKPAMRPDIDLTTGWTLIQQGQAQGAIDADAHHPSSDAPHQLRIQVTKTAPPGGGRVGAASPIPLNVREGEWFDVRFAAITQRGSVGMVFSLESDDGKVLARATLPEIGRGRRAASSATSAPATWPKYLVALHARAADSHAHLVMTPIEPTTLWLQDLTITPRADFPPR